MRDPVLELPPSLRRQPAAKPAKVAFSVLTCGVLAFLLFMFTLVGLAFGSVAAVFCGATGGCG